jgi:predicted DNA-binding transcriptional regulator AlpA
MSEAPRIASVEEMARLLGISRSALDYQRSVSPNNGPPWIRMGRRVGYPLTGPVSYAAWITERAQGGGTGR